MTRTSPDAAPVAPQRIASLLPSATEICFALGLGPQVVGVSHECDHPAAAKGLPVLTRSSIDSGASSSEIDRQVKRQLTEGLSLYQVEEATLRTVAPTLVVTQDTCDLCAVSFATVEASVARILGTVSEIVSLSPVSVDDVLEDLNRVARAAGAASRGEAVVRAMKRRFDDLGRRTEGLPRRRVLVLEWLDPPMTAGHWTPQLIEWAGGEPVLSHDRAPTQSTTWEALAGSDPEMLLIAPCGFEMAQARRELDAVLTRSPAFRELAAVRQGNVAVIDGNAYFNRPGPRLVESAWLAAKAMHPSAFEDIAAGSDVLCFPLRQETD